MTTEIKKVWFVDGQIIEQEIPESDIYKQKPMAWKLVPIKPTYEMLKAMDECSKEGYDERLYAGHAASVYMAAVEAAAIPPAEQQAEPPPEWPLIKNIIAEYGLDAISFVAEWKAAQQQAEPWGWYSAKADDFMTNDIRKEHERLGSHTHKVGKFDLPLYTTPPQRPWVGLTDEEMSDIVADIDVDFGNLLWKVVCLTKIIQATLKERNI